MFQSVLAIIRSLSFDTLNIIYRIIESVVGRTVHSSLPTTGPPGSPPFVIFFVFYDFLPLVLFCFILCVSWLFLGPWFFSSLFLPFFDIIKSYIYAL